MQGHHSTAIAAQVHVWYSSLWFLAFHRSYLLQPRPGCVLSLFWSYKIFTSIRDPASWEILSAYYYFCLTHEIQDPKKLIGRFRKLQWVMEWWKSWWEWKTNDYMMGYDWLFTISFLYNEFSQILRSVADILDYWKLKSHWMMKMLTDLHET